MNSKLLKEAIADAKAVRETALANAKIALEEAFTPKLQSMLSRKLQEELENDDDKKEEEAPELTQENDVSSEIGKGDGTKMPAAKANDSAAESDELAAADVDKISAEVGSEDENAEKVAGITENNDEDGDDITGATPDSAMNEEEENDEDDLDIDEIIKELEAQSDETDAEEAPVATVEGEDSHSEPDADNAGGASDHDADNAGEDEIDLDEILREMGYGDDQPEEEAPVAESDDADADDANAELKAKEAELGEAYAVIASLKNTINEVNLLNAKLLYVNKLFRAYSLTNEQKTKVVETLDRTKNVREVKLVYTTIAESFKIGSTATRKTATKLTESYASKPAASTAPAKQIIAEDNSAADRFKKLAGIIK
jgi:hypothetical protein